jgi:hypothetical protein
LKRMRFHTKPVFVRAGEGQVPLKAVDVRSPSRACHPLGVTHRAWALQLHHTSASGSFHTAQRAEPQCIRHDVLASDLGGGSFSVWCESKTGFVRDEEGFSPWLETYDAGAYQVPRLCEEDRRVQGPPGRAGNHHLVRVYDTSFRRIPTGRVNSQWGYLRGLPLERAGWLRNRIRNLNPDTAAAGPRHRVRAESRRRVRHALPRVAQDPKEAHVQLAGGHHAQRHSVPGEEPAALRLRRRQGELPPYARLVRDRRGRR